MGSSKNKYYEEAVEKYEDAIKKYTGNKAYQKQYELGKQSALDQNKTSNEEAQKYAAQQAKAAAQGAQSQATTAARAAGMNKAQAAMLGSQQNANAYQNTYGNAYGQQLGLTNSNQLAQQGQAANAQMANVNAYGGLIGAAQNEGQSEYNRKWGNAGNALGIGGSILSMFSDEDLKHYRECSKKVVYKTPSKIKSLKYETKKEN